MGIVLNILLVLLCIGVAAFVVGILVGFLFEFIEDWNNTRQRQRIQAERIMAEARIQMHTAQAAQEMLDVARDTLARQQQQAIFRVEQVDGHDGWKPHG